MDNNRPEGRKKRISGTGGGLYRRGEGQNTGPVGSGNGFSPGRKSDTPFTEGSGGGNYNGKRGGGRSPLGIIVLLMILLFKI